MNNKINLVVKFNDGESFIMDKPIQLKYKRYKTCIIGTDGIFVSVYTYGGEKWLDAFGGRKFDLIMEDGEVVNCYGQWWAGLNAEAREILGSDIISATANDQDSLKKCYVYVGYYAFKSAIKKLRKGYKGPVFEYYEGQFMLNGRISYHLDKKKLRSKLRTHRRNKLLKITK